MFRLSLLSGLIAAFAGVGSAAAGDFSTREVGSWTVAASQDGKGCFLTRVYDRAGRTTVLLGLDVDGTNHLSVLNSNWSIASKERLKLNFRLSKGTYLRHFAVGMTSEEKQGFVTSFEAKFPGYFAASTSLDISRGTVPVERLSLEGSGAAVAALRDCVAVQRTKPARANRGEGRASDIPLDPFGAAPRRKARK